MKQMQKSGIRCYVTGKVQGVWFRASTQELARELNLTGWASNCLDGRVEVVAFGDAAAISKLYEWLQQGPPFAKVKDVTREEIDFQEMPDFEVR